VAQELPQVALRDRQSLNNQDPVVPYREQRRARQQVLGRMICPALDRTVAASAYGRSVPVSPAGPGLDNGTRPRVLLCTSV
jgi:hypothetical protein